MHCNIRVFFFFIFIILTVQETVEASLNHPKTAAFESDIQKLQEESLQKKNAVLEDKAFQDFVAEVKSRYPFQHSESFEKTREGDLYIFVSFSLGENALENLVHEAGRYGATLVLRGFKDSSYRKTAYALQKIILKTGQGFIIDPELFDLFSIKAVPTYVLAKPFILATSERTQTPLHDRLQGHVSVRYALEIFSKEGILAEKAQFLLKKEDER